MSDKSAIEWTDATWNPTTGCDRVSPGCAHCYALDLAARLKRMGAPAYQADGDPKTSGPGFALTLHEDRLEVPLRWTRPRRIFVNSMSDVFHPDVPAWFIRKIWRTMARAGQHTFQVLTKRPERMRSWVAANNELTVPTLPNVWLGTSVENARWRSRIDELRETRAAIRFLSCEPLLGPLVCPTCKGAGWDVEVVAAAACCGNPYPGGECRAHCVVQTQEPVQVACPGPDGKGCIGDLNLEGIGWVIAGGESGPEHRPVEPDWIRDIRDACIRQDVPFLFKQWGGRTPKSGGRELDGRTWDEMP